MVALMDQCWDLQLLNFFGDAVGPSLAYRMVAICILGSLMFYSGESSTQTLFLE
jgi:hypothetical protein